MTLADLERLKDAAVRRRDAHAQFELGVLYIEGPGFDEQFFTQDIQYGLHLLREAASDGNIASKAYLFDHEKRLIRKLRRRRLDERLGRLPLGAIGAAILVTLVVVVGVTLANVYGWPYGLLASALLTFSVTACSWLTLTFAFGEKRQSQR